ncbi:Hint domain-containing protein [Salinihabitans flavidus]|uniref:Hint domain-containing protein n=1 Tax=Salinihabitans flavidus TaxID=569882 RepID=A0A1H8N915_9RHOB|nr:Hint domain-containing protein [Salinihabitans flavidus]SEO26008.1 Hint domain-containing protein [Salinihabitans flavidus]
MSDTTPDTPRPQQPLQVYLAADLRVSDGANLGDALSFAAELQPDDVYMLDQRAEVASLTIDIEDNDRFVISEHSQVGLPGAAIYLDSCITVMPPSGDTIEILILVEVDRGGHVAQLYLQPLAPLSPKTPYTLVGIDRDTARRRLAQLACVSFSRGTRITLATGEMRPVEDLQEGDRVLTRDDGPQPLRWIGQTTLRATGVFAPVVITAGTLNNTDDLVVSPDHRLFIYQRHDHIGAGRSELMVRARHIVNGTTVYVHEGGFVDYFQLVFDTHQIIFAEGISAETMLIDTSTSAALPSSTNHASGQPEHEDRLRRAYEVNESLLERPDLAEILRRASGSG